MDKIPERIWGWHFIYRAARITKPVEKQVLAEQFMANIFATIPTIHFIKWQISGKIIANFVLSAGYKKGTEGLVFAGTLFYGDT